MGLLRKTASLSTLGAVKYTSRRDAQAKAASAQARVASEEAKLLKAQRKQETGQQWDEILAAFLAGEVTWDDLSRMQKIQMPVSYQIRCKAAQRRAAATEGA